MANWYGTARSNYFKVKNIEVFKEFTDSVGLDLHMKDDMVMIHPSNTEDGAWPSSYYDDEIDDYEELDLTTEISLHLQAGQVAVLMEVGAEKLRYVTGYTVAVYSNGETVQISLDDIYEKAAKAFGADVTRAEY